MDVYMSMKHYVQVGTDCYSSRVGVGATTYPQIVFADKLPLGRNEKNRLLNIFYSVLNSRCARHLYLCSYFSKLKLF